MKQTLARMEAERKELNDKMGKLFAFITSDKFQGLDTTIKGLLHAQYAAMTDYMNALCLRSTRMETGMGGFAGFGFGAAITLLKHGMVVCRNGWDKDLVVFKQVPASIKEDIVPKMQSLPDEAKRLIMDGEKHIDYTAQCLVYNRATGQADSWQPTTADVFSYDWMLVTE